jgi:hypothetical protein
MVAGIVPISILMLLKMMNRHMGCIVLELGQNVNRELIRVLLPVKKMDLKEINMSLS